MSDADPEVLFFTDGPSTFTATEHSAGPWDRRHCHGGPVSALLTRACEHVDDGSGIDWQIARLTIELTRPVPVARPLTVETEIERPGRKVSIVAARLLADDKVVAHVRALRIRHLPMTVGDHVRRPPEIDGPAGAGTRMRSTWPADDPSGSDLAFHRSATEHRFVEGGFGEPGPCKVWIRILVDLIPGESPTPLQRVAAAADYGNGVSSALDDERLTFINPDLTIHLARPPEGEWIGLASHSVYGVGEESSGAGFAESALHDERGRLGRSVQSLILQEL